MTFLTRLFGFGGERREAPGAAPTTDATASAPPPQAKPAPTPEPAQVVPGTAKPAVPGKWEAAQRPSYPGTSDVVAGLMAAGCRADRVVAWAPDLAEACRNHGIDTPARVAMFLAHGVHETGYLAAQVESLNYPTDRLVPTFGAKRITQDIANKIGRLEGAGRKVIRPADERAIALQVYGGEWGWKNLGNLIGSEDPWVFRGHGFYQLTGRGNFTRFGQTIGKKPEALPALLKTIEGAAESAAHFFAASGCIPMADTGDVEGTRRRINGGALGLAEVRLHYAHILAALSPKGP